MKESEYRYSPTLKEVNKAMKQQARVCFKFYTTPSMTVEEYSEGIKKALEPLKNASETRKYSLERLKKISERDPGNRIKKFYCQQSRHARQITKVLSDMEINAKPKFSVYVCPISENMALMGAWIGFIDMKMEKGFQFDRQQLLEFEARTALEMMKTTDLSKGDVLLISSIMIGKAISLFRG